MQQSVAKSPRVTVYHAADCSLCERAVEVVRGVREEQDFELELIDIGGDDALGARYRTRIPVIEIDDEPAFTYFVDADGLRARLSR